MEIYPDHHIHTQYSRCCGELYTLKEIIEHLRQIHAPYYCVSDHIHYNNDDGYFPNHITIARQFLAKNPDKPLFLGAEMTIQDRKGRLPLHDHTANKLNYFLAGEHFIPGTSITMDFLPSGMETLEKWIHNDPSRIRELFEIIKDMYIGNLTRYKPPILVHPFSTLTQCFFTHKKLLDIFELMCETAQTTGTAIELNRAQIEKCVLNPRQPLINHPDLISTDEFYFEMIKIIRKFDINVSCASDAHSQELIGNLECCKMIINKFKIPPRKILSFTDPNSNIHPFTN